MTTGYQIKDQSALHFLTLQVVDWIDIFTRCIYRDIIIESLKYCQQNKSLQIFGYVIMSNHIHLIANSTIGELSNVIRDFKKFTANSIIKEIQNGRESRRDWMLNRFEFNAKKHCRNEKHQFWTHENHAIILYTPLFSWDKLTYIHNNPVRAGIVEKPEHYLYSSAMDYAGFKGLLDIVMLERIMITYGK